ncbi:hypothetical protein NCAS_0I00270 [Naumovozyma castellii]|uniref:Zn(2)-C6 fungal-type domain-containing protein n=1 Tax=Naumovozyma castellii TaxID=27288 RepID=G0VJL5_NAUCA|nr:hypothetical protein NCAS_0I00270 [Naumovozyma castellii CBS 4309]CCC71695.1 hypothetical protein NCAS_0I00270 [Naumovozyma castellii CBS 4309]
MPSSLPYSQSMSPKGPQSPSKSINDSQVTKKKRYRLSFVCQGCRRSKVKCDQEKPVCSRCSKHDLECVYDVTKQHAPRNPNKAATMARLRREVEYWKKKVASLTEENAPISNGNNENDKFWDLKVNLYKTYPRLIISSVLKREVTPLSENYLIIHDRFLCTLASSIFINAPKNSLVSALVTDVNVNKSHPHLRDVTLKMKETLKNRHPDGYERERIDKFFDRIVQLRGFSEQAQYQHIMQMFANSTSTEYLEDNCPGNNEYSNTLREIIDHFQSILPPYAVIMCHKQHFYENVYPFLPFIDKEMFEESLNVILFPDQTDPSKIKLKLGNTRLRSKVESIAILSVILKLSYISLNSVTFGNMEVKNSYVTKAMLQDYPISDETVLVAQKCLVAENWIVCVNENTISCLLYIWSFHVFAPENGDFFLECPSDILSNLIIILATSIGLNKDPSVLPLLNNPDMSDPRLLNLRRMQWLGVVAMASMESNLKGRQLLSPTELMNYFIDRNDPNALEIYMKRIQKDFNKSVLSSLVTNRYMLQIHELSFKRTQLALLLADLNRVTMSYKTGFSLRSVENLRKKINSVIDEDFDFIDLNEITEIDKKNGNISLLATQNSIAFLSRVMSTLILTRTSMALLLHFEKRCITEKDTMLPYFAHYFLQGCLDSISLASHFLNYYQGNMTSKISPLMGYTVSKELQLSLSSTLFNLLVIIMRLQFTEQMANCYVPSGLTEDLQKIEIITSLRMKLELLLKNVYLLASEHLRFVYFSVFKLLSLFDLVIQKVQNGDLLYDLFNKTPTTEIEPRVLLFLRATFNIDVKDNEPLVHNLKDHYMLTSLSVEQLQHVLEEVIKTIRNTQISTSTTMAEPEGTCTPMKNFDSINSPTLGTYIREANNESRNSLEPEADSGGLSGEVNMDLPNTLINDDVIMSIPEIFSSLGVSEFDLLFNNE